MSPETTLSCSTKQNLQVLMEPCKESPLTSQPSLAERRDISNDPEPSLAAPLRPTLPQHGSKQQGGGGEEWPEQGRLQVTIPTRAPPGQPLPDAVNGQHPI